MRSTHASDVEPLSSDSPPRREGLLISELHRLGMGCRAWFQSEARELVPGQRSLPEPRRLKPVMDDFAARAPRLPCSW